MNKDDDNAGVGDLSLDEFTGFLTEIRDQPAWRAKADKEMDYCDGNQLSSEILTRMENNGIPPAVEPLMGPTLDGVLGMEVKTRGDWKVTPDSQQDSDDVADALNFKLHQAEAQSKADAACSDAFASQIKVGLGWVFVGRESDPFKYKYRVEAIHRNELFFDWYAKPDQSDSRYNVRRKWFDRRIPELMFPDKVDLIRAASTGWGDFSYNSLTSDSGGSPDLYAAADQERGWAIDDQEWRDINRNRVCLFEVWYRRWERVTVLKTPDGRVVEYDKNNPAHASAIAAGIIVPEVAIISKVRMSWWMGPHKLADIPSPYRHSRFPYVPFWGKREDRTGVPFALARGMIYLQDQINALHSKSQWMMGARRVTRTRGIVVGTDEQFRQEVARGDADIILDPKVQRDGGTFKVETDLQLTEQQFRRLQDSRDGLRRVGGIYSEFQGQNSNTTSGVQFNSQVEQSNQSLADMLDNFKTARTAVGDMLLSLIVEDMIGKQESVTIDGKGIRYDKVIALNTPAVDETTGLRYLDNDVERIKLKVVVDNVPSAATFKQQQLAAMSEAFKSAPPQYQPIMLPFLLSLMDVPYQAELIKAIKDQQSQQTPEQIEQQIKQAVEQELARARTELELQKLQQQQPLIDAKIKKLVAETVGQNVTSFFSGTNAANQIAMQPAVAPMADAMLASAGFIDANAAPAIPMAPSGIVPIDVPQNTSPNFPPTPDAGVAAGIEAGAMQ